MEPGLGGQEKAHHLSGDDHVLSVAMEPGLGGQEKVSFTKDGLLEPTTSQWSLALAARKRSLEVSLKLLSYIVAMEPGLGGQEKGLPHGHLQGLPPVAMEPGLGGQEKASGDTGEQIQT